MGTGNLPKSIAIGLLFGLVGFAGNWCKIELFFNLDFLFGSFFAVIALLYFGPATGIVAGTVAATCTWSLWNHPWAIVIFASEILVLAWQSRRPERDLLTVDVLFWGVLGVPLVWFFYHQVMGVPAQPTLLISLKQALNGIANTFLAIVAYILCTWRRPRHLFSFRQLIFLAFVSVIVLPAAIYLIWNLHREQHREQDELVSTVARLSNTVAQIVGQRLEEQLRAVQTLAWLAGDLRQTDIDQLQEHAEMLHSASPGLHRLAVFDHRAKLLARSPRLDEGDHSTIGRDPSSVPFWTELTMNKKPFVTDLFIARIGKPLPLTAIVVPIGDNTGVVGYCTGILDEAPLRETFTTIINQRPLHFTLLDRQQKVIVSTRDDLKKMNSYPRPAGLALEVGRGVQHRVPPPEAGISIMERWRKSFFVREKTVTNGVPWTVVVEGSAAPMMARLTQETIASLTHVLLVILTAIGLSHLLSRNLIRTIRALEAASHQLPKRLRSQEQIIWPRSNIRELDSLSRNFAQTSSALQTSFASLQALNATLERRVAERTETLHYLSLHDELTGLFNRRAFDQTMDQEWRRATRLPQPLSLLLLDLDHFKNYNDTWGHLQGDACLQAIATAIQKTVLRAEDFAARYGGEEFAVILPMTTADDAVRLAERIRQAVEALELRHTNGTGSRVTISIGVASIAPARDIEPTRLLQMADQALYAAKSAGRNRVWLHPNSTQPPA